MLEESTNTNNDENQTVITTVVASPTSSSSSRNNSQPSSPTVEVKNSNNSDRKIITSLETQSASSSSPSSLISTPVEINQSSSSSSFTVELNNENNNLLPFIKSEEKELIYEEEDFKQRKATVAAIIEEEEEDEDSNVPNEKWAGTENCGFPSPNNCFDFDKEEKALFDKYMSSPLRKKYISDCKESWLEYFMTTNNGFYNKVVYNSTVKSLIRKHGIFPAYRKKIWLEINNVDKKMIENQGYYQKMLQVHQDVFNEAEHQIDLDLSRTFPSHPFFAKKNSKGRQQLKRILIAFSWRNPYVAYAQSLNYIVAMLLLHCDEETAFWLFVELVEEILPRNYYNPQLTGIRIDSKVLDELIRNRLPKIHAHFQNLELDCTAFCSGWFMRVFLDIFPVECSLRILDLVFAEGSKILFRTVLSYLKIFETQILAMKSMGEILHFINQEPQKFYDHPKLTKCMFNFYLLTRKEVDSLRTKYKTIVEKEDEILEQRRKIIKQKKQ